ncbi:hypothetical protein [Pseudogulbenkiania subflava]|uniref:hypothetical protein n=1 Tax=Pseudogulbenkiania subflava TaxID=451637 RepID=UPI00117A4CB6|nr:hypothetical protein [Pseudogulbenkiania subflava]
MVHYQTGLKMCQCLVGRLKQPINPAFPRLAVLSRVYYLVHPRKMALRHVAQALKDWLPTTA